jgi:hypothetical protein
VKIKIAGICWLLTLSMCLAAETGVILARAGIFMPTDATFKSVYGSSLTTFGAELRLNLGSAIALWAEGGLLKKTGATILVGIAATASSASLPEIVAAPSSAKPQLASTTPQTVSATGIQESTTVSIIPLELGALYRFASGSFSPYFGVGLGMAMFKEDSADPYLSATSESGFCACALLGASYTAGSFALDAKVKYRYGSVNADDGKVDVGGIAITVGVGISF